MAKIRVGFVSNSSSSSFVCDVCNYIERVRDYEKVDSDFYRCENGHIICKGHVSEIIPYPTEDEYEKLVDDGSFQAILSKACPICTTKIIRDKDLLKYLLNSLNITRSEAEEQFRETFKS